MTAGVYLIQRAVVDDFECVQKAWACCVMGTGLVYRHKPTNTYRRCLGTGKWCGLGWPLQLKLINGQAYFNATCQIEGQLCQPIQPMFVFSLHGDDVDWEGVPTEAVCPESLPPGFKLSHCSLRQVGEAQELVKFALLNRVPLTMHDFSNICRHRKISVQKCFGENYVSKRACVTSCVNAELPHETLDTRQAIIQDYCGHGRATKEHLAGLAEMIVFIGHVQ